MKKVLYVDACVNREISRTEVLAQALLKRLEDEQDAQIETLVLENEEALVPLNSERLNERTLGTLNADFSSPLFGYAKQFAAADEVVFAAPFWDLSFPALFKIYLEHLCSQGITFHYTPEGLPEGLVRIKKVYFVTTAGGYTGEMDYGWQQLRSLCERFFGIEEVVCFKAEGLDILTNDAQSLMEAALREIASAEL